MQALHEADIDDVILGTEELDEQSDATARTDERWTSAGEEGRSRGDINVTPLIDVVLVLLIIFMVLTPSMLKHLTATIPQEGGRDTPPAARRDADRRRVHRQARADVNGEPVAPEALAESLAERLRVRPPEGRVLQGRGRSALRRGRAPHGHRPRRGAKTLAVVTK